MHANSHTQNTRQLINKKVGTWQNMKAPLRHTPVQSHSYITLISYHPLQSWVCNEIVTYTLPHVYMQAMLDFSLKLSAKARGKIKNRVNLINIQAWVLRKPVS